MPERRFRDMSLTEGEVDARLCDHLDFHGTYYSHEQHDRRIVFEARAHRLLPLWREWALQNDVWVAALEEVARLQRRVAELEDAVLMACIEPADDCECAGCQCARQIRSDETNTEDDNG